MCLENVTIEFKSTIRVDVHVKHQNLYKAMQKVNFEPRRAKTSLRGF